MGASSSSQSRTSSTLPEPQTFLEKSLSSSFTATVLSVSALNFPFDALVVPVYPSNQEIRSMNLWQQRGPVSADLITLLLSKDEMIHRLAPGGLYVQEVESAVARTSHPISLFFVRLPSYIGKPSDITALTNLFQEVLDAARLRGVTHLAIPVTQPSTVLTYPRSLFCQTLVDTLMATLRRWEDSTPSHSDFVFKCSLIATDYAACRITAKYLLDNCEHQDANANTSTLSDSPNTPTKKQLASMKLRTTAGDKLKPLSNSLSREKQQGQNASEEEKQQLPSGRSSLDFFQADLPDLLQAPLRPAHPPRPPTILPLLGQDADSFDETETLGAAGLEKSKVQKNKKKTSLDV